MNGAGAFNAGSDGFGGVNACRSWNPRAEKDAGKAAGAEQGGCKTRRRTGRRGRGGWPAGRRANSAGCCKHGAGRLASSTQALGAVLGPRKVGQADAGAADNTHGVASGTQGASETRAGGAATSTQGRPSGSGRLLGRHAGRGKQHARRGRTTRISAAGGAQTGASGGLLANASRTLADDAPRRRKPTRRRGFQAETSTQGSGHWPGGFGSEVGADVCGPRRAA